MSDKAIFDRRSIRKFSNNDVPKEIVDTIISAGMAAPSAKNRQPQKCTVLGE